MNEEFKPDSCLLEKVKDVKVKLEDLIQKAEKENNQKDVECYKFSYDFICDIEKELLDPESEYYAVFRNTRKMIEGLWNDRQINWNNYFKPINF